MRSYSCSRRNFVRDGSLTVAASLVTAQSCVNAEVIAPDRAPAKRQSGEHLRMGFIGSGGRGGANLMEFYKLGEEIAALCDVDQQRLDQSYKKIAERCPDARRYTDYREMLAKEGDLDAVVVSTPDHMHAAAAIAAMRRGCHAYVEKPLVRTIWEAREFKRYANGCGVITQMGNGGNGLPNQRRRIEIFRSGVLGRVKEVHVSTNRPIWPQGVDRPRGSDPVPDKLDWDLWLGVAPERPFKNNVYHPFKWRGWFDFGTGAMGDIACHAMSDFFRGFQLQEVLTAECVKSTPRFQESYPLATTVKLVIRSDMQTEPITVYWYDGDTKPDRSVCPKVAAIFGGMGGQTIITERAVVRGDAISWNDEEKFKGFAKDEECNKIAQSLPRVQGHHWEFAEAIRGGAEPLSHHNHSVPLTEAVLLGCIAQQVPGELIWNARNMRFENSDPANELLLPNIRKGWSIT